ncbi:hypothetical protein [Pedobacter sp. L105]|uniref:hypothetical protein n=1 Tax=Pedobacter sp. L105 TaxID=1641871 RepID=UPI00131E28CD|nr:hypothetical protein [Pedobacter sp. L105]
MSNLFKFYDLKIKNIFFIFFLLTGFCFKGIAQGVPSPGVVLPFPNLPSANATALGTYGTYPISYTNGTPSISIPLYEIKTPKMSLPISISYHANGIKVNEQATSVGLGWTLNAGGAITRQINDLPDFDANGYKHKPVPKGVHASPDLATSSPIDPDPMTDEQRYYYGRLSMAPNQVGLQKFDGQPDDFFFNFKGKSGRFILKNTIDSALAAAFTTIPYSPLKIQYTEINSGSGDSFTLHDTDGMAYVFGRSVKDNTAAVETSQTTTSSVNNYLSSTGQQVASGTSSTTGKNVTAWYLTEMISPDRTDTIYFKYASQYNASSLLSYTGNSINMYHLQNLVGGVTNTPTINSSTSQVATNNINLSEIDFKNGKVVFEYNSRSDLGTYKLSKIRIYQAKGGQFNELKRLNMNQSYFNAFPATSQISATGSSGNLLGSRLRLDGVSEEGVNADGTSILHPPYVFNYYTGNIAYLGEYGQDLWGYWNGQANKNLIISNPTGTSADRVPDSTKLIAGTIQTIKYPTGGLTEFQFEPNQTTRTYTTLDTTFQTYHLSTIGTYNTTSTDQTFTAGQTIQATLQFSVTSGCAGNGCLSNQAQVFINDVTNGGTGTQLAFLGFAGTPTLPYSGSAVVNLIAGHIYHFYFPGSFPGGNSTGDPLYHLEAVLLKAGFSNIVSTSHTDPVLTGGLRVKRVINRDMNNVVLTTKRYNYKLPYYISGIFTGDFTTVGTGYTFLKKQMAYTDYQSNYTPNLIPYLQNYTENFTVSMAGASDGSLAYQEVEEYQDDQSGNSLGKTVYDFNPVKDDSTSTFSYVRINNSWRRNQLLEQRMYKGSGSTFTLIKDVQNTYSDLFPTLQDTTQTLTVNRLYSIDDFRPTAGGTPLYSSVAFSGREFDGTINGQEIFNGNTYNVSLINQINYRNALTGTVTTDYDLNGTNAVSLQENYFYDNPDHLMPTRTEILKSNLDKAIKRTIYTTDYALNNCNPASYLANLQSTLANLKSNFDTQSLPVYTQWIGYVFNRWGIIGGCSVKAGSVTGGDATACFVANNYNKNDPAIVNLYNQYGALKTAYRASVRDAVNIYNQGLSSYVSCYNTQLSSAVDSVKALMIMQQNNQVTPVELDGTWADHTSGIEYMASVNKAAFKTAGNTTQIGETLSGVFNGVVPYGTYTSQPNVYLRREMNYDSYNSAGSLISYHQTDQPQGAFIWGYNQQYPIAEVKNASSTQVAYTGFEEGVANMGNWNFSSAGVNNTTITSGLKVHAGNALYSIGSGAVTSSMAAGTYIVSYWASGALTVNGGGPTLTGNTDSNGWHYFEHQLTLSAQGMVTVSGTNGILMDELQLYPIGAHMKSYTYDPLIGITSSTDDKNQITYYEYDAFQRLINIRDNNRNIVKHTDYHYQGQ